MTMRKCIKKMKEVKKEEVEAVAEVRVGKKNQKSLMNLMRMIMIAITLNHMAMRNLKMKKNQLKQKWLGKSSLRLMLTTFLMN